MLSGALAFLLGLSPPWVVAPVVVVVAVVLLVVMQPVFDRARREEIIVLTTAGHPTRVICGDRLAWSALESGNSESAPPRPCASSRAERSAGSSPGTR